MNYHIIGGDGKEYGPISGEMMRQWHAGRRVNAATKARLEGTTDWRTLAEFPEFADLFGGQASPVTEAPAPVASSVPPPLSANATGGTAGKLSAMAVTSLVLGALGLFSCGATALVGLILGIVALVKIQNSRGRLRGFGLALAGTIVSTVFLMLLPVMAAMLLPAFAAAKTKAEQINCINNEKQLATAVRIYTDQHGRRFPHAATWCDDLLPLVHSEKVFKDRVKTGNSRCDYGFNVNLDGINPAGVSPQTVEIFEADGGWNANGGAEAMIGTPRHRHFYVVAFVDGSVKVISEDQVGTLRWNP